MIQLYIDDTKKVIVSARCIRTSLEWKKKEMVDKLECEVGIPLIKSYKELGLQSSVTVYYTSLHLYSTEQLCATQKQNITKQNITIS